MFPFVCSLIYYLLFTPKHNEVDNLATCSINIPFLCLIV